MTDLLGLLAGIHTAVNQLGGVRVALAHLDDMNWVVDRKTGTIYMQPGLDFPSGLRALTEALEVLAPGTGAQLQLAVGGEQAGAVMPQGRHLHAVPDQ